MTKGRMEAFSDGVIAIIITVMVLSLRTPFTTAWVGSAHFAPVPVALYGGILLCASIAYFILTRAARRRLHAEARRRA